MKPIAVILADNEQARIIPVKPPTLWDRLAAYWRQFLLLAGFVGVGLLGVLVGRVMG